MTRSTHGEVELDLVVAARSDVAERVIALELRDPSGAPLPAWTPGAHIDLLLGDGVERQYSLCGDDTDRTRLADRRAARDRRPWWVRARSTTRSSSARRCEVRGPRNHFPLEPAERYVFIAGGIGITPILAMLRTPSARVRRGAWSTAAGPASAMAFLDELVARYGDRVEITTAGRGGPARPRRSCCPRTEPGTLVYCCGPEPLLEAVEARCADWPEHALHLERFSPKEIGEPVLARVVRRRAGPLRPDDHRRPRDVDPARAGGGRHTGAVLVHRGHLRNLRDHGARGRGRPPRLDPHRRGAGGQRHDDDLRVTRGVPEAGPRTVTGAWPCEVSVCRSAKPLDIPFRTPAGTVNTPSAGNNADARTVIEVRPAHPGVSPCGTRVPTSRRRR